MENFLVNPFASYGSIVFGERFIGRKENIRRIYSRCLFNGDPANLALIGNPRIGKSSLLYHSFITCKSEFWKKNIIPIFMDLTRYEKPLNFFKSMVSESLKEIRLFKNNLSKIEKLAHEVQDGDGYALETYNRIQCYFKKIRENGLHLIFILDEFDFARILFKNNDTYFQWLRELSYMPEWKVSFVTSSRRTIKDIENSSCSISTFDGIFHKHYLRMFGAEEMEEYFERVQNCGVKLSQQDKELYDFFCGGHPYLLDLLSFESIDDFSFTQKFDLKKAQERSLQEFLNQYKRYIKLFRDDNSLSALIQSLLGPGIDVNVLEIDEFVKYGLIKPLGDKYVAYSEHFKIFLILLERAKQFDDFWPLWMETERALRRLVNERLQCLHGKNWIRKLEKNTKYKNIFDMCRKNQKKEVDAFGDKASMDILDFTYPADLFTIIFGEWNTFREVLGESTHYWDGRRQLIAKVRNPVAHNRAEALEGFQIKTAEGYCDEILHRIKKYHSTPH